MSPARMSKLESAMRVVLAFKQAFNRHDVADLIQLISEECVFETADPAPAGAVYAGKEAVTQYLQDIFQATPQIMIEIEEIFGLGDRCIMRWKYHRADGAGGQGDIRGIDLFQVQNGLICERLTYVKGLRS